MGWIGIVEWNDANIFAFELIWMELMLLGIVEDALFWIGALWWLWLAVLAYFYYAWARDHLAFSPILTLAVAGILIYYLVFEYPWLGSIGLIGWVLIYGGVLYLLPLFLPFFRRR